MRRTLRRKPGHEAGLTLAETLLVLAILALVAGLVMGRGLPGRGALRSAALESFLRDARSAAMLAGRPVRLVAEGARITGGDRGFDLGPGFAVRLVSDDGTILFLADGASPGGRLVVQPPEGGSYAVVVAPVVGSVAASAR
jgi:Tfp pilus assembly protein FimT